ncbi:3'-5' exonuclease domain and Ribonuclease H-like domain-containing protein [Strongyloides ratti]|uniref:3'-5' exonuclease domain and Ribonuclease H-like domain-containing protein n=1 Tax=Strongyloides ratti TaxID=34506 RepID=A0A090KX83_STRRB|nr:3'-5' exonuclease domain and Ribonuclease H-like domain-containing protein [Strongyloides ratti]CEF62026.1 3'-5' exonuclease domain and Ribonuclease H-like domain-containing protein [Strongyloides ratti]
MFKLSKMDDSNSTKDYLILKKLLESIKNHTGRTDEETNKFLIESFYKIERELNCNQSILFIYLLCNASDGTNSNGHNYIKNIIDIYERYLSTLQVQETWRTFLSYDVKISVIEILSKKSFKLVNNILPSIANIFELSSDSDVRSYLKKTISLMAHNPENNGFFFWCDYFEIYDAIDIHIYTLFVFKKKIIMGENIKIIEFLDKIDKEKRNKILYFLDKLMPVNVSFNKYNEFFYKNLKQFLNEYSNEYKYLEDIYEVLDLKTFEKIITNFAKRFNVEKEIILNTYIYKIMFRLLFQYSGYRKGITNGTSSSVFVNFYQHILSDLGGCPSASQTFIETFYNMRYGEEICFFTIIFMPDLENYINDNYKRIFNDKNNLVNFNMRFKYLIENNSSIRELYKRTRQKVVISEKLESTTKIFNEINVYIVETEEHFKEAMTWLADAKLIAVDTEFLPDIVGGGLCLCQIALQDGVLVFDAEKISIQKPCWKELNDFKVLSSILGNVEDKYYKDSFKRIIDVQFLYMNLLKEPLFKKFLDDDDDTNEIDKVSLKDITKNVIKYNMEKEFQYAAWRMRPLPINMIQYAAIDAFILIPIYIKMKKIVKNDELFAKLEDINQDSPLNKISTSNDITSKSNGEMKKMKERSTITEIVQFIKGFNICLKEVKNYGTLKNNNITILSIGKAVNLWKYNNRYNRILSLRYTDSLEDKILYIFNELKVRLDEKLISQKCIHCHGKSIVIVSRQLLLLVYYDYFLMDTENHKHFKNLEEINEETIKKNLLDEKDGGSYNSENNLYYSNDFIIDVEAKKIMLLSENKWRDLPPQKQSCFLKIYYTPNDFIFCYACDTFSTYHKI